MINGNYSALFCGICGKLKLFLIIIPYFRHLFHCFCCHPIKVLLTQVIMKNISTLLIFIIFLFGIQTKVLASKFVGGEITWECIPYSSLDTNSGKFIFTLKLYRECGAWDFGPTQTIYSTSTVGNFVLNEIAGWPKDISPICNSDTSFQHISCATVVLPSNFSGAVSEHIYRSNPIKIVGTPPVTGWMFYWGSCCRNPTGNVSNATSQGYKLRAIMYPKLIPGAPNYGAQNTFPCFDSSPTFAESPVPAIATGYDYSLDYHGEDMDRDSVVYEWGHALRNTGNPVNMLSPYSYSAPLPSIAQNVNNTPASLDSTTGLIQFKSYTTGTFLNCVKLTSYRDGIKLSEVWREFTVALMDSSINIAPQITSVFPNSTFDTVVEAGSLVQFTFISTDLQFLPNGAAQTMFITQNSPQFGSFLPATGTGPTSLSPTSGCKTPPCATLTPASGSNYVPSGMFGYQSNFSWQTDCAHLVGSDSSEIQKDTVYYRFLFTVKDDYCPVPAVATKIVTIGITSDLSFLSAPIVDSVYFDYATNDASFNWQAVSDPKNKFLAYYIYYSSTYNGVYTQIDSILNINTTSYAYNLGQASNAYFKLRILSKNQCTVIDTSDYSSILSMDITAMNNAKKKDVFELYQNEPNPATSSTKIRFSIAESTTIDFVLTDINGRIIEQSKVQTNRGENSFKLSLKGYSAGIYYYSIIYNNQKKTNNLIVK